MKEMSSGGGSILPRNKYWQGMASTVSGIGGPDMSNPRLLDMSADHQVPDIPATPSGDAEQIAMEKEVMELCEAAKRRAETAASAEGELEEAQCIAALDQLYKSSITCQLLVSTQLVRHLLPLTKHPRQKIQDTASELILSWRSLFLEQMKGDEENGSFAICGEIKSANVEIAKGKRQITSDEFEQALDVEVVKVRRVDQKGAPRSKKLVGSEFIVTEETNSLDNVDAEVIREEKPASAVVPQKLVSMIKCNDYFRERIREKLYKALSKVSGEVDEEVQDKLNGCDPIRVAITAESLMFEKWGHSFGTYEVKYRSILFNLMDPENPDFRRKVLLGHVKPEALIKMSSEEMVSDGSRRLNQQIKKERASDRYLPWKGGYLGPIYHSTRYMCGRCGHKKTTNHGNDQNSSAKRIKCLNCYQYWESTTALYGLLPV
ncbi:transcription elongation factor TFIIS [Citrus sinensis]|uniref:Transcription elongation factor TFIIS n=1 Tax=Citrus sinensis TaxID=2711 RepID=A0ACB8JYC9_CITSI|nr:transcription elongation factor TFIIS [Citrus sinensis]